MVRRNLKRMIRYPSMTFQLLLMPVVFLLLFVYVFGGTLGAGLGGPSGGRAEYLNYVTPTIILMAITAAVQGTSISIAMDMTEGIVDRFRTMAIARVSVLTGHVIGSLVQTVLAMTFVFGVAVAIGFRPQANFVEWLAIAGLLVAIASGSSALLAGQPLMTGLWARIDVPGWGDLDVGTPLLFDVGVYLAVVGVTLSIILSLAEE